MNEILWGEVHSTYCSKYTLTIRITVTFVHASLDYFHTSKLNLPQKLFLYQSYTPITLRLRTCLAHFRIKNRQSTFLQTFTRCTCKQHTHLWRYIMLSNEIVNSCAGTTHRKISNHTNNAAYNSDCCYQVWLITKNRVYQVIGYLKPMSHLLIPSQVFLLYISCPIPTNTTHQSLVRIPAV